MFCFREHNEREWHKCAVQQKFVLIYLSRPLPLPTGRCRCRTRPRLAAEKSQEAPLHQVANPNAKPLDLGSPASSKDVRGCRRTTQTHAGLSAIESCLYL